MHRWNKPPNVCCYFHSVRCHSALHTFFKEKNQKKPKENEKYIINPKTKLGVFNLDIRERKKKKITIAVRCDALIEPLQPWQQGQDFTAAAPATELSVQTHNTGRANNTKKTIFQHLLLSESLSHRNLALHDDSCGGIFDEKGRNIRSDSNFSHKLLN